MKREYSLFWTASGNPPGGILVTADIPDDWIETLDAMRSPRLLAPGLPGALLAIVAIHAPGADDAERLAWALAQQFDDPSAIAREPREGGRLWAVDRRGAGLHARMLLPAPHGSVVMASAMTFTPAPEGWLAELERVFDTVRVG